MKKLNELQLLSLKKQLICAMTKSSPFYRPVLSYRLHFVVSSQMLRAHWQKLLTAWDAVTVTHFRTNDKSVLQSKVFSPFPATEAYHHHSCTCRCRYPLTRYFQVIADVRLERLGLQWTARWRNSRPLFFVWSWMIDCIKFLSSLSLFPRSTDGMEWRAWRRSEVMR